MNTHVLCEKSQHYITRASCRIRYGAAHGNGFLQDVACRNCVTGKQLWEAKKGRSDLEIVADVYGMIGTYRRQHKKMERKEKLSAMFAIRAMINKAIETIQTP